jgi:glycosyltransferase involved in cell wall biosynthesis
VGEILKDGINGFLVPFEDLEDMVAATIKLIEDPSLRGKIGENGFQTVANDFSLEKMTADTEGYLKELCKG